MRRLLMLTALAAACGSAQTLPASRKAAPAKPAAKAPEAAPSRWPIASIEIEGNHLYTREQILSIAGLRPGQTAGRAEFDAARDRLVACGAFETVGYRFSPAAKGGYAAVFEVNEIQQAYPVEFEGLAVSSLELRAALSLKDPLFSAPRLPAVQPVIERYRKWIEEFLTAKGVPDKIVGSVLPGAPGDYAIIFRPARPLPAVAQVTFEGNELLSAETLGTAMAGVAIGSEYTEDHFRQILDSSIRPLYDARGRLRVAFPQVRSEKSKTVEGVNVFVKLDEGPTFDLAKVVVEGPTPIAADALIKASEIKTGLTANFDQVNEGLERMRKALRRAGYMEAKLITERRIDDAKKTVDVAVRVEAGPLFTMGKLAIEGLDLNGESEMRRIWAMKEGRPFNPDYPDLFLSRIREQAMFDNLGSTKSEAKINASTHSADVTLHFGKPAPARERAVRNNQ